MSAWLLDALLYLLLFAGISFGGIGVIGLLLFPDKWSRMFTGVRATLISFGLVTLAAIIYAVFAWLNQHGVQYGYFVYLTILLYAVIFTANAIFSSIILRHKRGTGHLSHQGTGSLPQLRDEQMEK